MKQILKPISSGLLAVIGLSFSTYAEEPAATSEPSIAYKVRPAFLPLKPGAVKPGGWLKDWARSAADGITGHLDERSAVFANGYKGTDFEAEGVKAHGTGWPLEQCAYWLDGLVRLAYILDDKTLIGKAASRLDLVVNGINGGGESLIYWRPKSDLDDPFNNWAHSHMGRALVGYYQATGQKRILDALVKVYRDYPLPDMSTPLFESVSGVVNLDPMLETYALSGDARILENAMAYARRKSFGDLAKDWANGETPDGHGVIFYENVRVPALLYPWTGEKRHLDATLRALAGKHERHGLPFGLTSAEEYLAGTGSTRHTETCNVACGGWTYNWLLRITGQSAFADQMERIFFNAGPVPVSRDYQTLSYYQAPNRTGSLLPGETPRFGNYEYAQLGHGPLCCVGNSCRVIPNYIMHMWMATPDGGLAATLHGPASVQSTVAHGIPVTIDAQTDYPFDSTIRMTVKPRKSVRFPLYLRVPAWCVAAKVAVNNQDISATTNADGFVKIDREWNPNDRIVLDLPMRPGIIRGRETPFPKTVLGKGMYHQRPLAGRDHMNEPYACVYYGPLLFALAIPDETPDKPAADAVWNYALDPDPDQPDGQIVAIRRPVTRPWRWQFNEAPIQLRVPARQFDWKPTGMQPLPRQPVEGGKPATITLVPYCCTKFHISMFPVTANTSPPGSPK